MYKEDFKIRDFVRENAEKWELFTVLTMTIKEMGRKINYEDFYRKNDVGHLSEYLALALIDYWGGDPGSASLTAEGIKMYIDNERGEIK